MTPGSHLTPNSRAGEPTSPRVAALAHALPLLVVLLLAFAVRVYHLDFQSLWGDEGLSLLRASLPVGEMIRTLPR